MKLIAASAHTTSAEGQKVLELANDADPLLQDLSGVTRIDLHFPKFSDGRAFSQARLLRGRVRFTGEIRATGDVLVDQVLQMERCGFDVAVLREDQDLAAAERQLHRFPAFYQGDAQHALPHFRQTEAA
ncbi:DUF934 domain-containing protein [Acidovorax sp. Leaf160]|uniref:DUF934 domain-containing protein n=1 Tax=Acidovorax sp. Leaf160 TaxID=1736280 RepID=UPI0006F61270|nr:DUF934 domain-containing protein [Acidovorax sp. Leaf160]KQR57954.1 hypothetical protein ASF94_18165 [Acidovorax sp. Leaf160]